MILRLKAYSSGVLFKHSNSVAYAISTSVFFASGIKVNIYVADVLYSTNFNVRTIFSVQFERAAQNCALFLGATSICAHFLGAESVPKFFYAPYFRPFAHIEFLSAHARSCVRIYKFPDWEGGSA